eukprot:TRINITY_DN112_c0_g1_i5.p1 TRINITY_DN112_c0_g1~~TRINITY_DN112_c0_g1_i5.p1  ORF type:complete len:417 (+),score=119.27 TRINITY_DN112_c0_g1_i5:51-1301(+)
MSTKEFASTAGSTVAVCGGGNAAHVMVGDLGSRGYKVNLFAPFTPPGGVSEAEQWKTNLPKEGMKLNYVTKGKVEYGSPNVVSASAAEAIPGAKYIFIPLPVFAHRAVLLDIVPHCDDDACIVAMPATGCFDWTANQVMKELGRQIDVAGVAPLPYVCRTLDYAKETNFMGLKDQVGMATLPAGNIDRVASQVEEILGLKVKRYPSFLPITLTPTNPIMHTGRLMGMFGPNWRDNKYDRMIKFYDETDELSNTWLHRLDDENQLIAKAAEEAIGGSVGSIGGTDGNVMHINNYLKWTYGEDISKWDTCKDCFQTNKQFAGVGSPMKEVSEGVWEPDFKNRYFQEDFPFGLMANRGLAELLGVKTPYMDEVIMWAQSEMGKKYLVDGKVNPDEKPQMTPQAFGYTLEDLRGFYSTHA